MAEPLMQNKLGAGIISVSVVLAIFMTIFWVLVNPEPGTLLIGISGLCLGAGLMVAIVYYMLTGDMGDY